MLSAAPGPAARRTPRPPASAWTSWWRRTPSTRRWSTQLEEIIDEGLGDQDEAAPTFGFDHLPSGDELADELQEFLQRPPDDG